MLLPQSSKVPDLILSMSYCFPCLSNSKLHRDMNVCVYNALPWTKRQSVRSTMVTQSGFWRWRSEIIFELKVLDHWCLQSVICLWYQYQYVFGITSFCAGNHLYWIQITTAIIELIQSKSNDMVECDALLFIWCRNSNPVNLSLPVGALAFSLVHVRLWCN